MSPLRLEGARHACRQEREKSQTGELQPAEKSCLQGFNCCLSRAAQPQCAPEAHNEDPVICQHVQHLLADCLPDLHGKDAKRVACRYPRWWQDWSGARKGSGRHVHILHPSLGCLLLSMLDEAGIVVHAPAAPDKWCAAYDMFAYHRKQ
eukprot:1066017-Pelagomonas_calceolata.AAC.1